MNSVHKAVINFFMTWSAWSSACITINNIAWFFCFWMIKRTAKNISNINNNDYANGNPVTFFNFFENEFHFRMNVCEIVWIPIKVIANKTQPFISEENYYDFHCINCHSFRQRIIMYVMLFLFWTIERQAAHPASSAFKRPFIRCIIMCSLFILEINNALPLAQADLINHYIIRILVKSRLYKSCAITSI